MPSQRLFIALETPAGVVPRIGEVRDRLRASQADVKWESDEKLHATLVFLGDTDDALLPEIVSSLERVGRRFGPVEVKYAGVGCFPGKRSPKVVWVGMEDPTQTLLALHRDTETCLVALGFRKEERAFRPHVTLGRVKGERGLHSLIRMMESITFESQPVRIRGIALVKSELKPSGSVYTTLKTVPLTG